MQLTWYGHSCFLVESENGVRVLMDPCDPETGYDVRDVPADIVTVSHAHHDHNYIRAAAGEPVVIDTPGVHKEKGLRVSGFRTYHDVQGGRLRGDNLLFLVEMDGIRLLHLGDLGHEPDPALVEAIGAVDVLLCPVGGVYTIDAEAARRVAAALRPQVFVPMHYMTKALTFALDPVERMLPLAGERVIHRINDCTCTISADALGEKRILLMRYKRPEGAMD